MNAGCIRDFPFHSTELRSTFSRKLIEIMKNNASHLGQGQFFKEIHKNWREWDAERGRGMKYRVNCACDALADGCGI